MDALVQLDADPRARSDAREKFTEWTAAGEMRHPAFLGLREDKKPKDVFIARVRPSPDEPAYPLYLPLKLWCRRSQGAKAADLKCPNPRPHECFTLGARPPLLPHDIRR
jgi:hypothetical protein